MYRTELFQHGMTETPLLEHPEDLPELEYPELPDFVQSIIQKIPELLQTSCQKIPKEVYCNATRPEEAREARHMRPSIRTWYILDPCQEEMSTGQILDILKGWQQHYSDNLPTAREKFALANFLFFFGSRSLSVIHSHDKDISLYCSFSVCQVSVVLFVQYEGHSTDNGHCEGSNPRNCRIPCL